MGAGLGIRDPGRGDRASAVELFTSAKPSVVLLDLGLPPSPGTPAEGLAALSELTGIDSLVKIIVITGQGEKETALQAIGAGAYDFLGKPLDMDELKIQLRRCFHLARLEREFLEMQQRLEGDSFEGLLGTSTPMQAVFNSIRKVATTDAPVLILGESGTGKEMTARAIHQLSNRRKEAFVAINCGAIPETLMESELFGHEKGSFTGAHVQRKGRIESAAGGTLFLDEIGEISPMLQVKLLRFLQEHCIERIGGRQEIQVDTRVIAATNADLKKRMADNTFREDLYYRLAVVQILLPALRERGDDATLIARALLQRYSAENAKSNLVFGSDALHAIRKYTWPGNVRELQNRVKRAVIMSAGKRVSAQELELEGGRRRLQGDHPEGGPGGPGARNGPGRPAQASGKITAAAAELGISRPTFYELMEKLGVQKPD